MTHLDLFSGIGGFAYAADQVFGDVEHIFCDTDTFCRAVLKKHWPESEIYDDIKNITNNPFNPGSAGRVDIVTGGFPCQPFSAAGLRRGTADKRHLWPEMLRVIRLTKPAWIIAENVRGITTWNDGVVFEQVCLDLEAAGYEVQPFIIPAVAVNAPHRRDRIWFVAHANGSQFDKPQRPVTPQEKRKARRDRTGDDTPRQPAGTDQRLHIDRKPHRHDGPAADWSKGWPAAAAEFCRVDDGLPAELDGLKLSKSRHRKEQLKAYGNAIVPQVAMKIMHAIAGGSDE